MRFQDEASGAVCPGFFACFTAFASYNYFEEWKLAPYFLAFDVEYNPMLNMETAITEALQATTDLRQNLVNEAITSYFSCLPNNGLYPDETEFEAAQRKAESVLKASLLSQPWLSAITGEKKTGDERPETLPLAFKSIAPPLQIPLSSKLGELRASSVALAALVGALVGMLILTPLLRLAVGLQDTVGMFLGAPLGAFGMVWLVRQVSRVPRFRKALQASLGVAVVVDTGAAVFRGKGFLGVVKRIFGYLATIFLLRHIAPQPKYDRETHKRAVELAVEQWLNGSVMLLACLSASPVSTPTIKANPEEIIRGLARHVYELRSCLPDQLQVAVSELIQEARKLGFEGLELDASNSGSPLVWAPEMRDKYNTFGLIEEGDSVIIERDPVILSGKVLERGLVRKFRRTGQ